MAIAVVSSGAVQVGNTSTTLDIPLTIPDPNAVIFAGICADGAVSFTVSAVWDSTTANSSLSQISAQFNPGRYLAAFYLVNPSTGTHSVTFTINSSAVAKVGLAAAYSGVNTGTPYDTGTISVFSTTASSGSQSTAVPSEAGDMLLSFVGCNANLGSSVTIGTGGTIRAFSTGPSVAAAAMGEWAGAATIASTWAWPSAQDNSLITFNVNAAGGAASPSYAPRRRTLMGLGL